MGRTGWILVMVAVLATGAAAQPPPTLVAQALAALDRGDPQQAQRLSDTALKDETLDAASRARPLLYRGLANALLGAPDAAMRDFTLAIDSHDLPQDERGQATLQRGFLRESLGQTDDAIGDYSAVIAQKNYSMAIALNKRANIYLARGRLADAQQDYVASLAAEGGQSQFAYYGLGRIAEAQGDTLAARGFYGKAIAIDARYADAAGRLAALGVDADARRIVLRPPAAVPSAPISSSSDQKDRLTPLPAVPPLPDPLPVTALRPGLDRPGDRIWPVDEIQLGAWRSESEATAAWQRVKARAGGLLDHLSPQVLVADLPGKGRYFRLRVRSGENAALMCARLAVKALDCFPVRD